MSQAWKNLEKKVALQLQEGSEDPTSIVRNNRVFNYGTSDSDIDVIGCPELEGLNLVIECKYRSSNGVAVPRKYREALANLKSKKALYAAFSPLLIIHMFLPWGEQPNGNVIYEPFFAVDLEDFYPFMEMYLSDFTGPYAMNTERVVDRLKPGNINVSKAIKKVEDVYIPMKLDHMNEKKLTNNFLAVYAQRVPRSKNVVMLILTKDRIIYNAIPKK